MSNGSDSVDNDSDDGNVFSGAWTSGPKGYLGSGTFIISADATQGQTATGINGLQGACTASLASGEVTVTYTFTPVPEPDLARLACLPLLGFLIYRRRRG